MVTIYFDKQFFSYLFNAKEEKYTILREKILSHKDEFIFLYSNAHILDLQQDATDIKYKEMDFMQSIVDYNHLSYNANEIFVATESPRSVFDSVTKIDDFSLFDNFDFSQLTQEQKDFINNIIDVSKKDLAGQLDFDWITKRKPIHSENLLVDKPTFTSFIEFVIRNFYNGKDLYKKIRNNATILYNPNQITADRDESFNERLSSAPLGLSFIDTIKAVIDQIGLQVNDNSMIYYMSYMCLDMIGLSKEPLKKVRPRNLHADCFHSFFGTYCDCIVSDDDGLRRKSQALYNLFHFSTQIYSIDEFIEKFDEAIHNNQKSFQEYLDEIINDYKARQVITSEYTVTQIKSTHKYFGYFNCMFEEKKQNGTVIILYKNTDVYKALHIREVEIIVNRIVNVFNETGANLPLFDSKEELSCIKADRWKRILTLDDYEICLTKFEKYPILCLYINLKNSFAR